VLSTFPTGSEPIRLVVIDDHQLVLQSVVRLLDEQPDMTVMASAATVSDGIDAVRDAQPDIVVLDYQLPDGDGASATRVIGAAWPQIKVIMLTGSSGDLVAYEAARAGCAGYVEKTKAPAELVEVIRRVHAGGDQLPSGLLDRLPRIDDLVVHYQPVVDLQTELVVGYEALVRWQHPTRGLVPPLEFIPLAETSTVIFDIGARVRRDACRQAAAWASRRPGAPARFMGVNLSGRELLSPDLPGQIAQLLDETGLDPRTFVIEVTESFFIGDADESTRRLYELKDLGVSIALDDFGTGYSSLAYLQRFPIDIIKLDKRFTDELPNGERGMRLVTAVGHLASELGAVAQAEGIETAEQADCLRTHGWQLGQGYHYSRPVAAAAIDATFELGEQPAEGPDAT
jgi:EAL domain-containing protein (putative c-di-GMP-specific phosphodiesterase class I)